MHVSCHPHAHSHSAPRISLRGVWRHRFVCKSLPSSSSAASQAAPSAYVCTECGWDCRQWVGKCQGCGKWNTIVEVYIPKEKKNSTTKSGARTADAAMRQSKARQNVAWVSTTDTQPRTLKQVAEDERNNDKNETASSRRIALTNEEGKELARVLGGGVVPGSLTLVGGEPGVGKSTLLLQLAAMIANGAAATNTPKNVLYVSGEESEEQVFHRATRLPVLDGAHESLLVHATTSVDDVLQLAVSLQPAAIVVDSIQTVYLDGVTGAAGSVTQVRECAAALLRVAKGQRIPILLVGHVTKAGEIAGPRVLEHVVDAVLYLENDVAGGPGRILRALKNRFGPTDEVGLFAMTPRGMEALPDASLKFAGEAGTGGPAAVAACVEGSRAVLVEVQALANSVPKDVPARRVATGVDINRMHMLLAILSKSAKLPVYRYEVYLNVTGGLRITDPSADLAVCVAVAASMKGCRVAPGVAFAAEVGLGGELRGCTQLARRLGEARRLGFERLIVAPGSSEQVQRDKPGITAVPLTRLEDVLEEVLIV